MKLILGWRFEIYIGRPFQVWPFLFAIFPWLKLKKKVVIEIDADCSRSEKNRIAFSRIWLLRIKQGVKKQSSPPYKKKKIEGNIILLMEVVKSRGKQKGKLYLKRQDVLSSENELIFIDISCKVPICERIEKLTERIKDFQFRFCQE